MAIIDISVPVVEGKCPSIPGIRGFRCAFTHPSMRGMTSASPKPSFGVHTGTHLDAPMHYLHDAGGIETLSLETLMGPAG